MFENFTVELDNRCLKVFPEMLEDYTQETLDDASDIGRYIFFEQYFNEFLEKKKDNESTLLRAAKFIEGMSRSDNEDIKNLVEIGILSGLVSRQVFGIAKYLGSHSKELLTKASSHTKIDRRLWWLERPTKVTI